MSCGKLFVLLFFPSRASVTYSVIYYIHDPHAHTKIELNESQKDENKKSAKQNREIENGILTQSHHLGLESSELAQRQKKEAKYSIENANGEKNSLVKHKRWGGHRCWNSYSINSQHKYTHRDQKWVTFAVIAAHRRKRENLNRNLSSRASGQFDCWLLSLTLILSVVRIWLTIQFSFNHIRTYRMDATRWILNKVQWREDERMKGWEEVRIRKDTNSVLLSIRPSSWFRSEIEYDFDPRRLLLVVSSMNLLRW